MVVSDLDIGCMDAFNSTRFDEDRWLVFTKNPVLPVLGQSWSDNLGVQWCEAVKAQCHDFAQQNLDLLGVVRQMRKRSVSFRCSNTRLRNLSNTAWAFAKVQIKRRSVVLHVDSCGSGVELGAFAIFCLAFADMICLWLGMPCLVSLCFTMFHWNLWICIDSIDFLEWHYIIYYNIIYIYILSIHINLDRFIDFWSEKSPGPKGCNGLDLAGQRWCRPSPRACSAWARCRRRVWPTRWGSWYLLVGRAQEWLRLVMYSMHIFYDSMTFFVLEWIENNYTYAHTYIYILYIAIDDNDWF